MFEFTPMRDLPGAQPPATKTMAKTTGKARIVPPPVSQPPRAILGRIVWEYVNRYDDENVGEITNAAVYPREYFKTVPGAGNCP